MKAEHRSYEYLIEKFGADELNERFQLIYGGAGEYIKRLELSEYLSVSEFLVDELVLDYYADIERLKNFHHIERAEPKKVAAYTGYWLQKRKPIQIVKNPDSETLRKYPQMNWVNENFAISILFSMAFDISQPQFDAHRGQEKVLLKFNEFQRSLRYYFTFRHINPQMLELMLRAVDISNVFPEITETV